MKVDVYIGDGQGLPQASMAPLVHIEDVAGTLIFTQAIVTITPGSYTVHRCKDTSYKLHPEMNNHLGLQYVGSGLGPLIISIVLEYTCTKGECPDSRCSK